jgi:signal transduction histidine kinase/ActR/RegA family two-component response regulator
MMTGALRPHLAAYVGDLLTAGGAVLLVADAMGPHAVPVLAADGLLVAAGIAARLIVRVAKPEAPMAALAVVAAGCLASAGLGSRWWVAAAGGAAIAALAPHLVSVRRALVWVAVATLMMVPAVLTSPRTGIPLIVLATAGGALAVLLSRRVHTSALRKEVELEMALDTERHKVAQLSAVLGRQEGREKRLERRAMLRTTLARRLGTIEAVAHVLARELEAALLKKGGGLETAAQRGVHWADQLSRLAGGGKAREQQTALSQIWPRVQTLVSLDLQPDHTLRTHLPTALPPVVGSGESWVQVLTALVENALDAMPTGGVVEVRQDEGPRDGTCRISVMDGGRGMTDEEMATVMRLDPTRPGMLGAGLGLAMVIAVVEGLGGEFTIESAPGAGTKVEIDVPFAEGAPKPEERLALTGRILLADDDEGVRRMATRMLETLGLEVVHADTGTLARTLLMNAAPGHFRAAILDVVMPGSPIEDVIVGMRQREAGFPVLLISGYDTMEMVDAVLALGGVRFLRKPFKRQDLYRALSDLFSISTDPLAAG